MRPIEKSTSFQEAVSNDTVRLRSALEPLPDRWAKPVLVLLSGLPGTGKSFFARHLVERLPLLVIETDLLRKALFGEPRHTPGESARLFAACHQLTYELLSQGVPILFDATNLQESHREPLYRITQISGAKLILVRTEASPQMVRKRLQQRQQETAQEDHSSADWQVYQRMRLSADPIRRQHFVVDTSRDMTPVVDKIVREVNRSLGS